MASASEVTELILRIDDVIASSGGSKGSPAGRMPHPEMDGMM